jgi:hypothetical protein
MPHSPQYPADLNLFTFEEDDEQQIKKSYNAIRRKDSLQIVSDEAALQEVFRKMLNFVHVPHNCKISIQNLFRISLPSGTFYIAQCLFDFGYPTLSRMQQSFEHKYHYQLMGYAKLSIDLGKTIMRPETKADKLMFKIFDKDIDFEGYDKFNYKYYLASNNKEQVHKAFTDKFLKTLAKSSNITLTARFDEMILGFEYEMTANQSGIVEDILASFEFLAGEE